MNGTSKLEEEEQRGTSEGMAPRLITITDSSGETVCVACGRGGGPLASGRFEDALHVSGGRVLLLSHRHCGVVVAAEERVEWILSWGQVAALRLTGGGDHSEVGRDEVRARP